MLYSKELQSTVFGAASRKLKISLKMSMCLYSVFYSLKAFSHLGIKKTPSVR